MLFLQRLPDGGPIYAETDFSQVIVEPWNAASALVFIGIALYWIVKLRGEYRDYPFISVSLPVLMLGGIGGTLYHGLRTSIVFLYLDIGPIFALSLAAALYLWSKIWKYWWLFLVAAPLFLWGRSLAGSYLAAHTVINLSYTVTAIFLLTPILLVLNETGWKYKKWVLGALATFAAALFFRLVDLQAPLPMGTHWLWHLLGAAAAAALITYLHRVRPLLQHDRRVRKAADPH